MLDRLFGESAARILLFTTTGSGFAMAALGFKPDKGRAFVHPDSDRCLEFPAPPLSSGTEPTHQVVEPNRTAGAPERCSWDAPTAPLADPRIFLLLGARGRGVQSTVGLPL